MIKAYFSGIKQILLQNIYTSKQSISIAVAWFTQRELFIAVLDALDRGVTVSIILIDDIINRSEYGLDFAKFVNKGGSLCFASSKESLMHDKFCVFDNRLIITGSYNWTYSAEERNSENIIITDDSTVVGSFLEHFFELWSYQKPTTVYTHKYISDAKEKDIIKDYDNFAKEISCMISENIVDSSVYNIIENARNNIAVVRLATLQKVNHRKFPKLKQTIGMRCIIEGKDNKVLKIIKEGQILPFTNEVKTQTASDNQTSIICEILYGKSDEADENTSLLAIPMDNLPIAKAGEVKFATKVTLDTNGYMHVEHVCQNTGEGREAVYFNSDIICYE